MIKDLKKAGVRKAIKSSTGSLVRLEHFTYEDVAILWDQTFNK